MQTTQTECTVTPNWQNTTMAGNLVQRESYPCGSPELFEAVVLPSFGNNWQKLIPSNAYMAYWIDPASLKVISYCEGDVSIIEARDEASFNEEIKYVKAFLAEEI